MSLELKLVGPVGEPRVPGSLCSQHVADGSSATRLKIVLWAPCVNMHTHEGKRKFNKNIYVVPSLVVHKNKRCFSAIIDI